MTTASNNCQCLMSSFKLSIGTWTVSYRHRIFQKASEVLNLKLYLGCKKEKVWLKGRLKKQLKCLKTRNWILCQTFKIQLPRKFQNQLFSYIQEIPNFLTLRESRWLICAKFMSQVTAWSSLKYVKIWRSHGSNKWQTMMILEIQLKIS